ncbi:hypothetical protein WISP_62199 [Willisornis vidua]|uniref:Uncharacterized protein n=1 Tax=Willisornis vidua TaxID=1566151 RepID=A0ABQ9DA80_9PASS|nr:hypothetical protein WISP_62199 [Willisornis vidua]
MLAAGDEQRRLWWQGKHWYAEQRLRWEHEMGALARRHGGNEALNRDEQSSLLELINNKEPTLIETIFTVLSYCTLSPKSLGIAFETYMEKEQLWNYLYSMTGFTRLAAQAVSIVISKLPTVIACLPPPIKYFFFLAERKMSRNIAELKKAGLLVWNLILIICWVFEDGNTTELLTGATLDRWSKEKLSLVRVCLESIMGKQKNGPKQVTQKIIQSIEQQRPNWIENQLLKARKLSTDCASVTIEGANLEEAGVALGFTEQKINMMVLDICHKPGGSEYLRQIYHIIRLNEEYLKEQLSCENSSEDGVTSSQCLPLMLKGREEQPIFNPFQVYRQSSAKVFNQQLKEAYKKDGEAFFTRTRMRGNGFKPKESRFRLGVRKKFCPVRMMRYWNRLPREVVDGTFLEMFKARLNEALEGVPDHGKGLEEDDL